MSIFLKGAPEIVRHYLSEAHLRMDQRWRCEHLGKKDKVTEINKHEVRGKDGHILTATVLEKEKPFFENAAIVGIGPKYPFYEDEQR